MRCAPCVVNRLTPPTAVGVGHDKFRSFRERGRPDGYFPTGRGIEERMQVLISAARAHPTNNFTLLPLHRNWREALLPRGVQSARGLLLKSRSNRRGSGGGILQECDLCITITPGGPETGASNRCRSVGSDSSLVLRRMLPPAPFRFWACGSLIQGAWRQRWTLTSDRR